MQTHSTHRHTLRQAPRVSGRTEVVSLDEIKIERDGARRKLADCLTTQCFRFCSGTPSSAPPKYTLQSGTVRTALVSPGWTVPWDFKLGGRSGQSPKTRRKKKKKQEKRGGAKQLTAHREVEEKDMFLSKINTSAVCQVLYNKRGAGGEMSLFLLLFKLVAQKNNKSHSQATYWHRVPE